MKRAVGLWQLVGFAVTSLLGTVLHFLYDWVKEAPWAAPISGVNESTWEHMKLLFVPMALFATVEWFFLRERKDFWCIKLRGILLGLLLIPVIFYTYNGAIGKSPDWLNIAIFFASAAIVYLYETAKLRRPESACRRPWLSVLLIALLALFFVIFTFTPPRLGIFMDPLTGTYGI